MNSPESDQRPFMAAIWRQGGQYRIAIQGCVGVLITSTLAEAMQLAYQLSVTSTPLG